MGKWSSHWLLFGAIFVAAWSLKLFPAAEGMWITFELRHYARLVRQSDCFLGEKMRLLDRIDALEARIDDGASIGVLRWRRCSSIIDELCEQGITPDEVRLIERELLKLEKR